MVKPFAGLGASLGAGTEDGGDGDTPNVFIIIGRAYKTKDGTPEQIHVMVTAPDEDSAVRFALNGLSDEGYEEAELDQIGLIDGAPDEEPHASAYQGALEGECAIIRFDEE
jgi:hypothetical protein